jgi:hypothetical protein
MMFGSCEGEEPLAEPTLPVVFLMEIGCTTGGTTIQLMGSRKTENSSSELTVQAKHSPFCSADSTAMNEGKGALLALLPMSAPAQKNIISQLALDMTCEDK